MVKYSALKLIVFILASAAIIFVSRASLRNPHAHGFWRFFAWEIILLLVLLNVEKWFVDPFSITQIVSWLLLVASLFLVIHSLQLLRVIGQPQDQIENTTRLVIVGAYQYIRHPLYASLFYLAWGAFFKEPSWLGISLALGATAFLIATAKVEEAENLRKFGVEYARYMNTTTLFIPYIF